MATDATAGHTGVIKECDEEGTGVVTAVAFGTGDDVVRALAQGHDSVVTAATSAHHRGVIYEAHPLPKSPMWQLSQSGVLAIWEGGLAEADTRVPFS